MLPTSCSGETGTAIVVAKANNEAIVKSGFCRIYNSIRFSAAIPGTETDMATRTRCCTFIRLVFLPAMTSSKLLYYSMPHGKMLLAAFNFSQKKKTPLRVFSMVEMKGLEPSTSRMRTVRSPS